MSEILVIGSINEDVTLKVSELPLPGETVLADSLSSSLGGKGANQAITLARMGADVSFIGAIGGKKGSDYILEMLENDHINVSGISRLAVETGSAFISIDKHAENNIIVFPGANYGITKDQLNENIGKFKEANFCLLQLEIPSEIIEHSINLCKENEVKVVLNPAPFNDGVTDEILKKVDFYIPNELEFIQTLNEDTSISYDLDWYKNEGKIFSKKYNLTLIITLGSQGALLINNDEATLIPAVKVTPVDTTAAGDSFIGGFLAAFAAGDDLISSISYGTKVAAKTISRYGAVSAIPYKSEVE